MVREVKLRTREFIASKPTGIRSAAQAYHLSRNRDRNGLAECGACVRVPGLGVIWDTARWEAWVESHRS